MLTTMHDGEEAREGESNEGESAAQPASDPRDEGRPAKDEASAENDQASSGSEASATERVADEPLEARVGGARPWQAVLGRAALVAGQTIGRGALAAGRAAVAGYRAIDPDVRRQVAELPLMGLTMLAPRQPTVEPKPDDGARPIVCVHGLQGAAGNFAPLRAFLATAGRRRTYAVWFEPDSDLLAMAARLADVIDEVLEVNHLADDAQVDIIAHSMGGLITRLALLDPAVVQKVHTLVTLGTPHHGTTLARLAATSHTLSLRPSSPVLAQLAHQIPWAGPPALPRLVSLWSAADIMLLPSTCAIVDGADNRELAGVTHTGLLLAPTALFATLRALDD